MAVTGIARLEHFFRLVAGLDIDKEDIRRLGTFIERKIDDLLLMGLANAKANDRDVLMLHDLPIGKGLQECIQIFARMEKEVDDLGPIFTTLARAPQIDLAYGEGVEGKLSRVAGGLSVALAKSFKTVWPSLRNPRTAHWETAFRLFDLVL